MENNPYKDSKRQLDAKNVIPVDGRIPFPPPKKLWLVIVSVELFPSGFQWISSIHTTISPEFPPAGTCRKPGRSEKNHTFRASGNEQEPQNQQRLSTRKSGSLELGLCGSGKKKKKKRAVT